MFGLRVLSPTLKHALPVQIIFCYQKLPSHLQLLQTSECNVKSIFGRLFTGIKNTPNKMGPDSKAR